jgi:hypothetical protein
MTPRFCGKQNGSRAAHPALSTVHTVIWRAGVTCTPPQSFGGKRHVYAGSRRSVVRRSEVRIANFFLRIRPLAAATAEGAGRDVVGISCGAVSGN